MRFIMAPDFWPPNARSSTSRAYSIPPAAIESAAVMTSIHSASTASVASLLTRSIRAISYEIARMDRVSNEATEAVLAEWIDVMTAADSIAAGGMEYAREVLERAFGGQKSGAMMKRIQAQISET